MEFLIADTFTASLARLTVDEQKAVKITTFDLQTNPSSPGIQMHKLEHGRDRNFWSARVNSDVRIIVHRTAGGLLLCYGVLSVTVRKWVLLGDRAPMSAR